MAGKNWLLLLMLVAQFVITQAQPLSKLQVVEYNDPATAIDGYLQYIPPSYHTNSRTYPLIIFLHGGALVGGTTDAVGNHDLPNIIISKGGNSLEANQHLVDSFIVICPHLSEGDFEDRQFYNQEKAIEDIVQQVNADLRIDRRRIYLTGLSRGGHGTYGLGSRLPHLFAAIVPIAGGIHGVNNFKNLRDMPMWIIHNQRDPLVNHNNATKAVQALEDMSEQRFMEIDSESPPKSKWENRYWLFSSIDKEAHNAWTPVYESVHLYKWLLSHKKG